MLLLFMSVINFVRAHIVVFYYIMLQCVRIQRLPAVILVVIFFQHWSRIVFNRDCLRVSVVYAKMHSNATTAAYRIE
jgi:hypothetical protein